MRSVDNGDLTTRARIRNAAIELIGTHGFAQASTRLIAQAAGVSPALVMHHFGDKRGLVAACNAHIAAMFTVEDEGADSATLTIATVQAALQDLDAYGPALRYLARALADDESPATDELFDRILDGTLRTLGEQERAGLIHPQRDPRGAALLLTVFGLAPLVLSRHFARALGAHDLTPEVVARVTLPLLELFTHGLYRDDALLAAAEEAMEAGATT